MNTSHNSDNGLSPRDLAVLRRLAEQIRAASQDPVNLERKQAWHALDEGKDERVMILAEFQGIRDPIRPVPQESLECTDPWGRSIEGRLRDELYPFEVLKDDHVIEPYFSVNWQITQSDYGVEVVQHYGGDETHMGSRSWEPPLRDLDRDFAKLRPRGFTVNREETLRVKARLESVFDGILPVRIRGGFYWTLGLTQTAIELIGLENLMVAMYDCPAGLHRVMAFLRDDALALIEWLERENLYSLNNENDYIGSGSMGYTRALPRAGWKDGQPVRRKDLWALSESQETVGVGPDQFEEFVFPYQRDVVRPFGRCYYGCCEPVNNRWHVLKRIPNLARVSVSPWADQAFMAQALGRDYVFSRKPNPALISTGTFDEAAIRADVRQTLDVARGCRLEMIMKDVHTLDNQPGRLARWVRIAREEAEARAG